MSLPNLQDSLTEFMRPYWYLLGFGLALLGGAFVFASQTLVVYSDEFLLKAAVYVLLQVTGWVIVIEWLRLGGYLPMPTDNRDNR